MTNTLGIALSGLKTAQSAISTESHNIANASTAGFTKKHSTALTQTLDGAANGVSSSIPYRIVDEALLVDEREKISSSACFATKHKALNSIQLAMGQPGKGNSLGEKIKDFSNASQALSIDSTSTLKRKEVLRTLDIVTQELGNLSTKVQSLRRSSDAAIKSSVDDINANIKMVESLNKTIISNTRSGLPTDDLIDQRDDAIRTIAKRMDITVSEKSNGSVFLQTGNGMALLSSQAVPISHNPTTFIGANSQYNPDPGLSNINHITIADSAGNLSNITDHFKGGDLAGHIELRDQSLPNLQSQLDRLATELRDKLNADHNLGSGYPPATTLTGARSFNDPGADQFQGAGTIRVAVIDKATGAFVGAPPYDLDLGALGAVSINDLAANLNGGLGVNGAGTAAVTPDGCLTLSATNPNHGIALVPVGGPATEAGTGTNLGFSHYFGLNDLITSRNEVYENGPLVPGIASMLGVRQDLVDNDALLSRGQISDDLPTPAIGDQGIFNGDSRAIQRIVTTFNALQTFENTGGLGDRQVTFADYASIIVSESAQKALNAEKLMIKEQGALANIEHAQGQISGVDTQESLLNLLEWQRVYMGCSTVIGIEKDNFSFLMQVL